MMVKICGITNLEDAMAAVGGGAAALGFNFFPGSPRYIEPAEAAEIIAKVPSGVCKVGVFVDEAPDTVRRVAMQIGLHVAQLHGNETPDRYPQGLRVWKAMRVRDGHSPASVDVPAEAVLLDGPASGETFDWALIPQLTAKLIVAGGLDAANVRRAIEQTHPWGVDACSRIESSPGRKDHFKMAEFLKAALAAVA